MKKLFTYLTCLLLVNANAQIGDGWDWAFNTGTIYGATYTHLKYTADGSEILMGGTALAAAYFGSTTLTAPPQLGYPGNIKFFGKINASTGVPTIIRSFANIPVNFDCITTDDAGNFYIGGAFVSTTDFDFGNGVLIPASAFKHSVIAKFDSTGTALWAKTFQMGATGSASTNVLKLAVSNAGNIFFWGFNGNPDSNNKRNAPLYKLDANGNTIWFKDALNNSGIVGNTNDEAYLSDKFIDDNENVHLFVSTASTLGFTFNGISYPTANAATGSSTLISLNANGDLINGQTFQGGVSNFQVNKTNGNLIFSWNQFNANPGAFQSLPHPFGTVSPIYVNAFTGIMEVDINLNFIKAKDYSTIIDNPFQFSGKFLALPNGKLIMAATFEKTVAYSAGVDSFYPAEPVNYATALVETDTDWQKSRFITGGKAPYASQSFLAVYNDTYLVAAQFDSAAPGFTSANLPTTSFGTVTLTGMNAATDLTTAYGQFSNVRTDVALAQCKSPNFPTIASTTWLGLSDNWNTPTNWSNGVPTNTMKAIFNAPTAFYPTVSATPTAATLEVSSGLTIPLPTTLVLGGGLKNDGAIVINNAGLFQGFGSKEWKGSGSVNFIGTAVSLFYGSMFTNSLILDTNLTTFYNTTIPSITFNSGKVNLGNKKMSITNASPTAISGTSTTSYIYGGILERAVSPTGIYEFPVGNGTYFQSATIATNNLVGVNKIATSFTAGAITGTTPSTSYNGVNITSALNGGWFTISPDTQPASGTYDVTLKIQNSTNTSATVGDYIVIKRDNATSPWAAQGTYNMGNVNVGIVSVTNSNLTSFSDFAIGKGASDISLSIESFTKNAFLIYPNPTTNSLNLTFENTLENANLKLISITGQTVLEKQNISGTDFSLDVSDLNSGMYLIQITSDSNSYTSKFIKQ